MTSPDFGVSRPSERQAATTTRASDADREAVVRQLHDALGRGLLTLEECDDRVAAAYASRFVADLAPLTADLPSPPAAAPVAPGWRALLVLAWLQLRTALAGMSWRGIRARPRVAIAAVMVLAVLSFGAVAIGEVFEHGDGDGIEHVDDH
jgi:hypothetical protein